MATNKSETKLLLKSTESKVCSRFHLSEMIEKAVSFGVYYV